MEEKNDKIIDPSLEKEISVAEGDAREILEKFEKKRIYTGAAGLAITIIAVATSCYHLAYAYLHPFFALDHRAIHWMLMSALLFSRSEGVVLRRLTELWGSFYILNYF